SWVRTTSPSRAFRWSTAEPVDNQFVWFDEEISRASAQGISVLGTIGQHWPSWADQNGLPRLDKWAEFVTAIVQHYKHRVKYWEIWNEPNWQFTPTFYADLLRTAATAMRAADPQAKIVGLGGVTDYSWCEQVLKALGP